MEFNEKLQELRKSRSLTQEELAEVLSKNRSSIAHSLRLLKLHPEVKKMIEDGVLSAGHGKDLVSLPTEEQPRIAKIIAEKKLTVKEAKKEIKPPKKTKKKETRYSLRILQTLKNTERI